MGVFSDIAAYLRIYQEYIGRRLYIVFGLTALAALAEGLGIALLLPLLKSTQGEEGENLDGKAEILFDLLEWMGIADSMIGILLFIGGAFIMKGVLKFAEAAYNGYLRAQLLRELKGQLFDLYANMQYRHYISQSTGHFINVINGQIGRFLNSFGAYTNFLAKVITTIGYLAIAFYLTWVFALTAVGVGVILLFLFKYLNAYVRDLSRRTSKEMSTLNKLLVQSLQTFKYVVSTNQTPHLRGRVVSSIERLTDYQFKQSIAGAFTGSLKEPLSVLFIISIIIVQVTVFNAPVAPLFVAILLFNRAMISIIGIQSGWQNTMNLVGGVEMVTNEFDAVSSEQEQSGSRKIGPLHDQIELRDLSFAYDMDEDDPYVLKDVNLTIPVNTTVAFVGESGAGKSTLIDLLTLLLRPQKGNVFIDGVPGEEIDLPSWRSQIGYVSQETVVFDDTVANNISLWSGDFDGDPALRESVEEAAKQAYAHDFIMDLPDGYNTVVGDRGVRLSGGQRQRLFIARELFKNPNLLILDEATSALDTESERYIQDSIDALKGEMTVVIIAHRLSTIKNVDRVYVLDDGHLIEQGSYDELRNHTESRFREMVEMQSL
jgi:subfamily B ATP-binding cassette protein MsbA